jgi:8-oxo-dGTP diphosphatase
VIGAFRGAKVGLVHDGAVLTYLRDDFAHLPWPAHWDLPGGGREGCESPVGCALRELDEEFGLRMPPERLIWHRRHDTGDHVSHFFAGHLRRDEIARIRFGSEGRFWRMMPAQEFLTHPRAIPVLQHRLSLFLHG